MYMCKSKVFEQRHVIWKMAQQMEGICMVGKALLYNLAGSETSGSQSCRISIVFILSYKLHMSVCEL